MTNPKNLPTQSLGIYVWNYMSALWNGFASSSDFIVVVMTIVRFKILNKVDQCGSIIAGSDTKPHWLIVLAIISSLLMHIPYLFQFYIVPCSEGFNNGNFTNIHCWRATTRLARTF
jgi:hypothetical protein